MADETRDDGLDPEDLGTGQGGGTGGTVGNEGSVDGGEGGRRVDLEGEDPDAWDARLADEEQLPDRDDPDLPGDPLESDPVVDDLVIPGAEQPETGDRTEGGPGRPGGA